VPARVREENIPPELKALPQFVVWRYTWKDKGGKWDKPPSDPKTGGPASHSDPATWATFECALSAYRAGGWDGIGFVFTEGDPFAGVDLDDCRDPQTGQLEKWATEIVATLDSYCEVSPSRSGVKLVLRGRKPGPACRKKYRGGEVEVYHKERYFCLTGERLKNLPVTTQDRTEALAKVYRQVWPTKGKQTEAGPRRANDLSDEALLDKARAAANSEKFRRLYDQGDTGGDHSAADVSLLAQLGFWTGWDRGRMDRLFRASALMRDKWDERRGEKTYGERSLDYAFECGGDSYKGNGHQPGDCNRRKVPGGEPGQEGDGRTAYEIILAWFKAQLVPQFRRGNVLFCEGVAGTIKTVRITDVCDAPHPDLVDLLMGATDAPTLYKSTAPDRNSLAGAFFRIWSKVAFKQLLSECDEEDQAAEINGSAEEEFRSRVAAALLTHATLGQNVKRDGLDVTEMQRRPLIDYALAFAKKNACKWGDVRGYQIWSRQLPDRPAEVAVRKELFGQLQGFTDLARLSATKFTRLAGMYGVGEPDRVKGGRSVVLSPGFVAELLQRPDDTLTDHPRVRAYEEQSVKVSESTHEHESTRVSDDTLDDTSRGLPQSVNETVNGKGP
jgi:hypothetical protein